MKTGKVKVFDSVDSFPCLLSQPPLWRGRGYRSPGGSSVRDGSVGHRIVETATTTVHFTTPAPDDLEAYVDTDRFGRRVLLRHKVDRECHRGRQYRLPRPESRDRPPG